MEDFADIDLRCSVIAFKGDSVLLVHRTRDRADDWVLPGGAPRLGESRCARRETLEETGLPVGPGRVAFILEALGPDDSRRVVDLVFLAVLPERSEPGPAEEGLEARFVPLDTLPRLTLRPPIAGHLRALHARGPARTAAYLGNLWRPDSGNGIAGIPGRTWAASQGSGLRCGTAATSWPGKTAPAGSGRGQFRRLRTEQGKRLGEDAASPHQVTYRKLTR